MWPARPSEKVTNLLRLPEVHSIVGGLVGEGAEGPEGDAELIHGLGGEQLVLEISSQTRADTAQTHCPKSPKYAYC